MDLLFPSYYYELSFHKIENISDIQYQSFATTGELSRNVKERQKLDLYALYSKKEQLCFYDMEWNEELGTLKPTGLIALLLGSPYQRRNSVFVVDDNDVVMSDDVNDVVMSDDDNDVVMSDDDKDVVMSDDDKDVVMNDDDNDVVMNDDVNDVVMSDDDNDVVMNDDE